MLCWTIVWTFGEEPAQLKQRENREWWYWLRNETDILWARILKLVKLMLWLLMDLLLRRRTPHDIKTRVYIAIIHWRWRFTGGNIWWSIDRWWWHCSFMGQNSERVEVRFRRSRWDRWGWWYWLFIVAVGARINRWRCRWLITFSPKMQFNFLVSTELSYIYLCIKKLKIYLLVFCGDCCDVCCWDKFEICWCCDGDGDDCCWYTSVLDLGNVGCKLL